MLEVVGFGQRHGPWLSSAIVASIILFIAWIGYITETRFSLYAFYLVPIILSALWLGWRWGCAVSVFCVLMRIAVDTAVGEKDLTIGIYWNRVGHLTLYLVLVGLLHALITLQRQLEQRVQQRTAALEQALRARDELQRQLFDAARRERSNIGHELHDGLGQHLTATSLAAKMLSSELESDRHPAAEEARHVVRMTQEAIAQTRQLARGLLLAAVEPDRLVSELEELAADLEKDWGVPCRFTCSGIPGGLDLERASHLFYIAQEAARNALRHARPNQVEISLRCRPDVIELSVTDDGSGPPKAEAVLNGMGIRIMTHRSELIGGSFSLEPGPGTGTRAACTVALAPSPVAV